MFVTRWMRHLGFPRWRAVKLFPTASLERIEQAVAASESRHAGQIRVVVEPALDTHALFHGQTAQGRAVEVFSALRVWDTPDNSGVLIYLLLADRDVEILADRGIHASVGQAAWEAICREMEADFRAGRFEAGILAGVSRVSALLVRFFPRSGDCTNALPNRPLIL